MGHVGGHDTPLYFGQLVGRIVDPTQEFRGDARTLFFVPLVGGRKAGIVEPASHFQDLAVILAQPVSGRQ